MLTAPEPTRAPQPALDDTDRLIDGVFEPPRGFAVSAIARNKWLVCLTAVLFAVLGTAYGVSRPRSYTASATLEVGQVNPNSPGFNGFAQSATSLATAFSRGIYAGPVLETVQRKLGVSPLRASARLSAEPIPTSPAFQVIATGPTEAAAVRLANVSAYALIAYESKSNSTNPEAESLLREYQHASLELRRINASLARRSPSVHGFSSSLASVEAEKSAAEVKLRALSVAYTNAISSRAPSSGLVSLLSAAVSASSDHSSKIERYGLIGLLAGIAVGCMAAILFERRRVSRRLAGGVEMQSPQRS
jgi:capsular polysaccharide biosynthesis protein